MDDVIVLLHDGNTDEIIEALSAISKATLQGAQACQYLVNTYRQTSPRLAEVVLAIKLRHGGLIEQDCLALRQVASLYSIGLNAADTPSTTGLKEFGDSLQIRYKALIKEAHRLENLRLSLRAVALKKVLKLLTRLQIEVPSVVDDALASLPLSLGSMTEKFSDDGVELQFPAGDMTRMQKFAIGAGDTENILIRLTLGSNGVPIKFCVHLSSEFGNETNSIVYLKKNRYAPFEISQKEGLIYRSSCGGRLNRGAYQLSQILLRHFR